MKANIDIASAYQRYQDTESLRTIAQDYKVHWTTLYNRIEKTYPDFPIPSARFRKIPLEDRLLICELYEEGATIKQLAEDFKVAIQTINKILIVNNIPKRRKWKQISQLQPEL